MAIPFGWVWTAAWINLYMVHSDLRQEALLSCTYRPTILKPTPCTDYQQLVGVCVGANGT
jgi:hypothetical protein